MSGIYYLLSLIAFGVIVGWLMRNDRLPPGEPTTGFLRMKDALGGEADAKNAAPRSADMLH